MHRENQQSVHQSHNEISNLHHHHPEHPSEHQVLGLLMSSHKIPQDKHRPEQFKSQNDACYNIRKF